jgi:hypothetical protein
MNIYNTDELGYYSRQTFNCRKDLFSIANSEKFVSKFTAIWIPTALWLANRFNQLSSFMKLVSARAQTHENTHTTEDYYIR